MPGDDHPSVFAKRQCHRKAGIEVTGQFVTRVDLHLAESPNHPGVIDDTVVDLFGNEFDIDDPVKEELNGIGPVIPVGPAAVDGEESIPLKDDSVRMKVTEKGLEILFPKAFQDLSEGRPQILHIALCVPGSGNKNRHQHSDKEKLSHGAHLS